MRNQILGLSKYIPSLLFTFLSIKKSKNEKAMRVHDLYTFLEVLSSFWFKITN